MALGEEVPRVLRLLTAATFCARGIRRYSSFRLPGHIRHSLRGNLAGQPTNGAFHDLQSTMIFPVIPR